jgi:hypothetical protein
LSSYCRTFFINKGILDAFLKKASRVRYADFHGIPANTALRSYNFRQLGLLSAGVPDGYSVGVWHDLYAAGTAWTTENVISVGSGYYRKTPDGQRQTIVHEVLHIFYDGSHQKIVKELLGIEGISEPTADAILVNWLESDCTNIRGY